MSTIRIHSFPPQDYTLIPNWFIDQHIANANGDFVKVLLLLLRTISTYQNEVKLTEIADKLLLTESDVVRALKFWDSKDVLSLTIQGNEITGISFDSTSPSMDEIAVSAEVKEASPAINPVQVAEKPQYSMEDLTKFMSESSYKDLIYVTGRYLGKNLNQYDLATLISLHDWLGLPIDVIEWLVEYCASNDHRNMRYIEKVAIEWADRGINTLEKAKAHTEMYNKKYFLIKKNLGFANRTPVPYEIKIMDKWLEDYRMDINIILEACQRTMKLAPSGSFTYADKIVTEWYKNGVKTMKDIEALDQIHNAKSTQKKTSQPSKPKNSFINFEQRDYDYDDLEKKAFERLLKKNSEGENKA